MRITAVRPIETRDGTLSKDEVLRNFMVDPLAPEKVQKRPAMWKSNVYAPAGQGFGAFNFNDTVYVWTDSGSSSGVVDESLMARSFVYVGDVGGGYYEYEVVPDNPLQVDDEVEIGGVAYGVSASDGNIITVGPLPPLTVIATLGLGRNVFRAGSKFYSYSYSTSPAGYSTRSVTNPSNGWSEISTSGVTTYPNNSQWTHNGVAYFIAGNPAYLYSTSDGINFTQSPQLLVGNPTPTVPINGSGNRRNVLATYNGELYSLMATATQNQLYSTTDGGATWTFRGGGLPGITGTGICMKVIANGSTLICFMQNGTPVGVYTSTTGLTSSWTSLGNSSINIGLNDDVFAYGGDVYLSRSGVVYKSTNNGLTWTTFSTLGQSSFATFADYGGHLILIDPNTFANYLSPQIYTVV